MTKTKIITPASAAKDEAERLTGADFVAIRDRVMTAGGILQAFAPSGLDHASNLMERDLRSPQALMLSPIAKKRAEHMIQCMRAAETLRDACAKLMLYNQMIDPEERPQ